MFEHVHYSEFLFVCFSAMLLPYSDAADYTLSMDQESSCTKTHFYGSGDVFTSSANGAVHNGSCPLTFSQSEAWNLALEPCLSLCVKILGYTMESCHVKMTYYDGINDLTPVTFDCHTFPPVFWCSSKNDMKVTVSETKNYDKKKYSLTLEIKPFCGTPDHLTTDMSVIAHRQTKPSSKMNQTALIVGAVIGSISILFVLGWFLYCYIKRHRHNTARPPAQYDRQTRASTPNQQVNRYAPIDRNPMAPQPISDLHRNQVNVSDITEKRQYTPNLPSGQVPRGQYESQKAVYSDLDRVGGEKWYSMAAAQGPTITQSDFYPYQVPASQISQYMLQNQVYKYPQFNNKDGEMHTVPTDTRYVVYDFDYENHPMERKFSAGKTHPMPHGNTPVKDLNRSKVRETIPVQETIRVMPSIDSTTTDQTTSDNDSSVSNSSDDDTTDDQMSPGLYEAGGPYGFSGGQLPGSQASTLRLYDPKTFQRIDSRQGIQTDNSKQNVQRSNTGCVNRMQNFSQNLRKLGDIRNTSGKDVNNTVPGEAHRSTDKGPVPPTPKDFQQTQTVSPERESPWPLGSNTPYSMPDRFVV